jgi:hypothetical protein
MLVKTGYTIPPREEEEEKEYQNGKYEQIKNIYDLIKSKKHQDWRITVFGDI